MGFSIGRKTKMYKKDGKLCGNGKRVFSKFERLDGWVKILVRV
jgi:hypothetical protein